MGVVTPETINAFRNYERKRGSFEVESHLYGTEGEINPGCWVIGDTVYGDMYLGDQNWGTFSRPVFAYLVHLGLARVPSSVTHTEQVSSVEGYSKSFTSALETEVHLGAGFLGSVLGGKLTSSMTEGISHSTTKSREIEIVGPGVFHFYQMHMVFAHCLTGAGKFIDFFKYAQARHVTSRNSTDLCILTSIATSSLITVAARNAVKPLEWEEIQAACLMTAYKFPVNNGMWRFNYDAYNQPGSCY
ncbi:monalysin family beta-barrel pore-forming toxin [Pseudomonas sp. PSKL.D1]|uniref:monalysin family beta-barrel pore-forming toxin n=1 Tax=Pseudomonas sp. PSKL.D1 TaxID=3029060 RepID=UPI0023812DC0|nr:monalysin family beta-barrel pore-forming toxin [Pseudomonas sp. PSKL.D1]WDY57040.1 monalysin family beta-barrel pore-forming toxin [Pseudomonas sp. PSKL.D1]